MGVNNINVTVTDYITITIEVKGNYDGRHCVVTRWST